MCNDECKCVVCGYEVSEWDLDSDNVCPNCRMVECSECYRTFFLNELNDGLCDSCEEKLEREYERDRQELEREYWSSQF